MNEYTLVELPAIDYIKNVLGYRYIHGNKLIPELKERESYNDVILMQRFETAIKRLNPWLTEINLSKVKKLFQTTENLGNSLLEINEKIHKYIVDLEYTVPHGTNNRNETVKFIDFENINNNDFLVTNQFKVQGVNSICIPDIVIFINGIPIVVLEAKSPLTEQTDGVKKGKKEGYEQLRRYMNLRGAIINEGIERLFHTNFFTGIINKYKAYVGTISSNYDYYLEWKDPYPVQKEDLIDIENNGQNIMLQGMLEKSNLLKIMQFFILFENEGNKKIKKITRYQQFRACLKTIKKIKEGKTPIEKGGVIWHTQGSGKSLTMVMLSRMIRRTKELQDSTIVVITDRIDLDKQIYNTFIKNYPSDYTIASNISDRIITRAETVDDMKKLLSAAQAKIIMTTIQKFQTKSDNNPILEDNETQEKLFFDKEIEILTNKTNVIVFTDEAHRSQYSNLAVNMRKSLPNATFIGFTGTPIEKEDKSTYRTFGNLIDSYKVSQAVEDGNTVAIVYEGRREDLHIIQENLNEDFKEYFKDKSDDEKEAIKQKYFNIQAIAEADERIDLIAKDLLKHYKENSYKSGFKAQLVAISRIACVKYYNAIQKYLKEVFPDNPIEVKIVFSCENNEKPELVAHRTTKAEQALIIDRFKKDTSEDNLCILIVKDMLITGFDAPVEDVMYIDRPLKEHSLLQAVARVNRTYSKEIKEKNENGNETTRIKFKTYGYIVDYFGITKHLNEALALFDNEDVKETMENINSIYKRMLDYKEEVMRIFGQVNKNNLDDIMNILKNDDIRAEFEAAFKRFAITLNFLMPNHVEKKDLNDLKWFSYIRAAAKIRFEPEKSIDISDCGNKAKELISKHLKAEKVYQWIEPLILFEEGFEQKTDTLSNDEAKASCMEHALKYAISVKMKDNPVYYTSLLEKLIELLNQLNMTWEERKKALEKFIHDDFFKGEDDLTVKFGFNNKRQFAIFEILKSIINKNRPENDICSDDIIKKMVFEIENTILGTIVKGFIYNQTRINELETALLLKLTEYINIIKDADKLNQIAIAILDLAINHYADAM